MIEDAVMLGMIDYDSTAPPIDDTCGRYLLVNYDELKILTNYYGLG